MRRVVIVFLATGIMFLMALKINAQDILRYDIDPPQDIHAPTRLFKTQNIFTFLELDTRFGYISQVQISIGNTPLAHHWINKQSLLQASDSPRDGRFTLYPTQNIFNFILVDQDTGQVWQCQWSTDPKKRMIVSLPLSNDDSVVPQQKGDESNK